MTANKAVAEAARLAKPQVIPVYPITPQTTISEYLAQYVADEKIDAKYVKVESEHSAISAAVGASGAGVRVFTATSSQGLMLMHEILFAAAGMRTPFVLADANRAISAPLNIWNDQQDSIAQRDAGWLQIYVENAQEALDTTLMAYKISENPKVLLPSMVCLDGFILTHTVEPVEIPDQEPVDEFLPPYKPEHAFLDPKNPMSIGNLADPDYYLPICSMLGNFQTEEAQSKIQFGSAWWFNDNIDGMREQMKALANLGAISKFVGMVTDSRSFLSYPRHEYFRRILCNLLGDMVENGLYPEDYETLCGIVRDISYNNAVNYFGIEI